MECYTDHKNAQINEYRHFKIEAWSAATWFKHILFMTEHDKGLGRDKKLCLALSKTRTHTCTYSLFTLIK